MIGHEKKGTKVLAALGLILATIIWGSAFVIMKNSVDIISPTYLLAFRFTIATLVLSVIFWKKVVHIKPQDFLCGSILGLFIFISYLFQTYGLKYTTASKNAFITTLYVILVPFLHWFFNRAKPSGRNVAAAVIAVIGLGFLSLDGNWQINTGDMLTLVCGFFFAVHIVFIDRFTVEHDPIALTIVQMLAAALLSFIMAPLLEGSFDPGVLNKTMIINLLYLGIFSTMLGFLLQTVGQKYLTPNTSSILLSFESVFGLVFSVIFLGDPLTLKLITGCILMFGAVILSEYKKTKNKKMSAERLVEDERVCGTDL